MRLFQHNLKRVVILLYKSSTARTLCVCTHTYFKALNNGIQNWSVLLETKLICRHYYYYYIACMQYYHIIFVLKKVHFLCTYKIVSYNQNHTQFTNFRVVYQYLWLVFLFFIKILWSLNKMK